MVATLVALGLGLLVDWAAGGLPGTLVLPVGLALLVGLTQLTTWSGSIAPATPAIVAVLGGAGLLLRRRRLRLRGCDRWAAAVGGLVFLFYLAPVAFSGHPAFTGYVQLGDTSIHLELADRMIHHGATLAGLAPSGYEASLHDYFTTSYPTGAHTALGALGGLTGVDLAWVYHPFLAWVIALGAVALYELTRSVVPQRALAALVAFVAAQATLAYGFAMQGAIKELMTIAMLATLFALLPWAYARAPRWRAALPLAVASGAALGAIDVAAGVWLAPALLGLAIGAFWRLGRARLRELAVAVVAFAIVAGVLAAPTLAGLGSFVHGAKVVLTSNVELGDLSAPLDWLQAFGIWPRGDFRLPLQYPQDYVFVGLAMAGVGLAIVHLWRRRAAALLGFGVVSAFGCWYVSRTGSPWADAKALTILAPALLLLALIGGASLGTSARRLEGTLLVAVLSGAVLWTNALAYHDVQLSNWPRLHELERIGERYAGQGPAFTPEFEEFSKYFLRRLDPTSGPEPWKAAPAGVVPGQTLRFGFSSEIGQYTAGYLDSFRLLVIRRSPVQSRPPVSFRLVSRGRFYDVWRRDDALAPRIVSELPLGSRYQRGAVARCPRVRALAGLVPGGRLAYAAAPRLVVARPSQGTHSQMIGVDGADPEAVRAAGPGFVSMPIHVTRAGRYSLWVQASLSRPIIFLLDGRQVGTAPVGLSPRGTGEDVHVVDLDLPAGRSILRIDRRGGSLGPGNGSGATLIGPSTFAPVGPEAVAPRFLPAARWHELCGRYLDWTEAVR